jgi:proteasome activator subunit 4
LSLALEIFKQLVEPSLDKLDSLLTGDNTRDATWRNDFCRFVILHDDSSPAQAFRRHLTFVRDAFGGTPTLAKEIITQEDIASWHESSDIMSVTQYSVASAQLLTLSRHEIPEMIAHMEQLNSGFPLTDPTDPRYQYYMGLRQRFGRFLHRASVSLLRQGEQSSVDAVVILVRILALVHAHHDTD